MGLQCVARLFFSSQKDNLLNENPWITEAGFAPSEFIIRQLAAV